MDESIIIAVIGFCVMLLLLFLGMRIGVATGLVALVGIAMLTNLEIAQGVMADRIFHAVSPYSLSVLPMFILMGEFANYGGMSEDLYNFAYKWLGRLPGGLAVATTVASAGFGAVTGSSVACCATMGKIAIPEMERYRYDPGLAASSVAAAGCLAAIIPPSIVAVFYAMVVETSVGRVLMACVIPGIILTVAYSVMISFRAWRNPVMGPAAKNVPWKESFASIRKVWAVGLVFLAVVLSIMFGWATPTEAGSIGVVSTLLIGIFRRKMTWAAFRRSLVESARVTAMCFFLLAGAMMFSLLLCRSGSTNAIGQWFVSLSLSPTALVGLLILFYIPLGMFIDNLSIMALTLPIFYPVIVQTMKFDPAWFGVLVVLMTQVATITPPVGVDVFVVAGAAPHIPVEQIFKGILWFFVVDIVVVGLVLLIPEVALFMPDLM